MFHIQISFAFILNISLAMEKKKAADEILIVKGFLMDFS